MFDNDNSSFMDRNCRRSVLCLQTPALGIAKPGHVSKQHAENCTNFLLTNPFDSRRYLYAFVDTSIRLKKFVFLN